MKLHTKDSYGLPGLKTLNLNKKEKAAPGSLEDNCICYRHFLQTCLSFYFYQLEQTRTEHTWTKPHQNICKYFIPLDFTALFLQLSFYN